MTMYVLWNVSLIAIKSVLGLLFQGNVLVNSSMNQSDGNAVSVHVY